MAKIENHKKTKQLQTKKKMVKGENIMLLLVSSAVLCERVDEVLCQKKNILTDKMK